MALLDIFRNINERMGKRAEENIALRRAQACLSSNEFKDYREAYEKEEREIIGTLINEAGMFVVGDAGTMEKFGAKCLIRLNRLRDVRSLLVKVTVDSRKGDV